jgi:hypothetical protein
MPKKLILFIVLIVTVIKIYSQTIEQPNYGLKSHPTLDIESIVLTDNSTTFFMVIENQSLDGTFCADKNIFIILPNGKRLKIKGTEGIPRCPETHVFKTYGEKMLFSLTFPALPEGTKWIDLIEDCNEACFSFNSLILDVDLNQKIDHAFSTLESGQTENASFEFEKLLSSFSDKKCSYQGAIYYTLVELASQMGNTEKAKEWLEKLEKSDIPLKAKFIENLEKK